MNKKQRATIEDAIGQLEELKALVELLIEEEEDKAQNIPESMTARQERADEIVNSLNDAASNIGEAMSDLQSASE